MNNTRIEDAPLKPKLLNQIRNEILRRNLTVEPKRPIGTGIADSSYFNPKNMDEPKNMARR